MSVPLRQAPFKTSSGVVARSLDSWFSDTINVAEFASLHEGGSGFGTNTGNDAPCFEAAFAAAFKTGGVWNGLDNRHLNKPVFIPAGRYRITDPLYLEKIVGGHIHGASKHSTLIRYEGDYGDGDTLAPLLHINGAANLCIEKMQLIHIGNGGTYTGTGAVCLNLDWDGDESGNDCDGLHHNHFQEVNFGGGVHCIIIADSGEEGHSNLFLNCDIGFGVQEAGGLYGVDVRGPLALNNSLIGGGVDGRNAGVRCPSGGGSMHVHASSLPTNAFVDAVFIMESGHIMMLSGSRTEAVQLLRQENGIVILQGMSCTNGADPSLEINGGKCIVEGCDLGVNGVIEGTGGQLYISGTAFNYPPPNLPLSGYSGTIVWDPDDWENYDP